MKKKIEQIVGTLCKKCKCELDFDVTGMQAVKDGYMCDDCYFEELGNEVEKYPIYTPRHIGNYNPRKEI